MLFPSETRADECRIKNVELRISKEGIISAYFQSKFDIGYSTFDIFRQAPLWEIRGANLLPIDYGQWIEISPFIAHFLLLSTHR